MPATQSLLNSCGGGSRAAISKELLYFENRELLLVFVVAAVVVCKMRSNVYSQRIDMAPAERVQFRLLQTADSRGVAGGEKEWPETERPPQSGRSAAGDDDGVSGAIVVGQ